MLNHTINLDLGNKIYGMINMEAVPKFDIKSVIKSGIKFDISKNSTNVCFIKTDTLYLVVTYIKCIRFNETDFTWIGH